MSYLCKETMERFSFKKKKKTNSEINCRGKNMFFFSNVVKVYENDLRSLFFPSKAE